MARTRLRVVFVLCSLAVATGCATEPPAALPADGPLGLSPDVLPVTALDRLELPPVDVEALVAQDLFATGKRRVSEPVAVNASLATAGTTEQVAGGALWRLRLSSPGAVFLSFIASELWLPPGARMFVYSVEQDYVAGPYTDVVNNAERRFGSPAVPAGSDGSVVVEVYTPRGAPAPALVLESVSHGYRDFRRLAQIPFRDGRKLTATPSIDAAFKASCEVDVNCPEGDLWQDEKRAVAEIYDGTFVCTGTMLNNAREDCRNFFLTANHCVKSKGKASSLVFYWNYENSACGLNDAPVDRTSVGSTLRATNVASDFTLLELNADPDPNYFVYHAGWNRSASAPSSGATIHHPNDLPKKISFENDPIEDGANFSDGWGDTHWRVTGWDVGTTEPGSSGCGLFNDAHQVVGQLTGGVGGCGGGWDEFGKLSTSFAAGLEVWLDPDGTGAPSVAGNNCVGGTPPPPPPPCDLGQVGDACSSDSDCCSNTCRGKAGSKTCKG